jgi:hypothetical protein
MKIGKKSKVYREISKQDKNRKNSLRLIIISVLVALVLFISLTIIQGSILNQEEKKKVFQVIKDIDEKTKITEDNIDEYFMTVTTPVSLIPDNYITNKRDLIGKFTGIDYVKMSIVSKEGIVDKEGSYEDGIDKPIEVAFNIKDLSLGVAGTIREGDYINIYGLMKEKQVSGDGTYSAVTEYKVNKYYTFKHVYVSKAFDGSGNIIDSLEIQDTNAVTMMILVISEDDAEMFNEMLANCDIRVTKLIYDTKTDYKALISEEEKETTEDGTATNVNWEK